MKITFITNYMTHHQLPFCLELYRILGDDFTFVATNKMDSERKDMGWDKAISEYSFIREWEDREGGELIKNSDVVLCGGTHELYIRERMDLGKITFRYFERLYKTGQIKAFIPTSYMRKFKEHTKRQKDPVYLLCAGAYVPSDFNLFGAYKDKMFKWGYFTKMTDKAFPEIEKRRNAKEDAKEDAMVSILWTGRMLDWKHPELVIEAARLITSENPDINYRITLVGEGQMRQKVESLAAMYKLTDRITFSDFLDNESIRDMMEEYDIYLMTSDFNEGWGAVVNEAMDKGMAIIGSVAAGSVPYLLEDGRNGLVYKNQDIKELSKKLTMLINDSKLRKNLGENAYNTIHNMWNAKVSAERFVSLCKHLIDNKGYEFYDEGPLSRAEIVAPGKGYKHFVKDRA